MKEWRIRLLILFSLISIAGLLLIQTIWIKDAIEIKEGHFRQAVNHAVTNAVRRIGHQWIIAANKDLSPAGKPQTSDNQHFFIDSLLLPFTAITDSILQRNKDSILIPGTDSLQPPNRPIPPAGTTPPSAPLNHSGDHINTRPSPPRSNTSTERAQIAKLQQRIDQILESVTRLREGDLLPELPDPNLLDQIITEELEKEGLFLSHFQGVYLPFSGNLVFCDSLTYHEKLLSSDFVYNLFPGFHLSNPAYLLIYFPDERSYLFSRFGWVLFVSLILALLLLWSLFFITKIVYQQKKVGEMKNDFINNMTHEFKTPVSTISLACEALKDKDIDKTPELIDNYLGIISTENRRLGNMAEQILQTAVIDKGHLYFHFDPVDLHDLIQHAIAKFEPVIQQMKGVVSVKLLATNPTIQGDRSHLYNMVSNLLDNAVKYSPGKPDISILTTSNESNVIISIKDHGIGISKANQKKVFEKLYRVPTGNIHNVKGFGLGLSYVKYIVDGHHGTIKLESELHKGSTFTVSLPRQNTALLTR